MITWIIIGSIALALIIFYIGICVGHHNYAKKMIEKWYGGDIIIDMSNVESDTLSVEFDKNPKELMGLSYTIMGIKIRE